MKFPPISFEKNLLPAINFAFSIQGILIFWKIANFNPFNQWTWFEILSPSFFAIGLAFIIFLLIVIFGTIFALISGIVELFKNKE